MITFIRGQPYAVLAIWAALAFEFAVALVGGYWTIAYLALATFGLSILPTLFANRIGLRIPSAFLVCIVAFIFATIFLGEAFDYYERFWWWDVLMHAASALVFGLLGVSIIQLLFEGERYAAPPWAIAFFGFCFAMTIGALWEIFEYAMDQNFGLNMQKSGLPDTMWDFIVNTGGASLGALVGFFYLKGREVPGFGPAMREFVRANRHFFRRPPT